MSHQEPSKRSGVPQLVMQTLSGANIINCNHEPSKAVGSTPARAAARRCRRRSRRGDWPPVDWSARRTLIREAIRETIGEAIREAIRAAIRRHPMHSRAFRCTRHRSIRARDTQMLARVLRTVACSDTRPTITELDHDRIELDARLTNHLEGLGKESAVVRVYVDLKQRHVLTIQKPATPKASAPTTGCQRHTEVHKGTQRPSQRHSESI